ncbi:MAG TPA: toxin-antitoxin system HicB family antitoxin [Nocardioidaceae bacterium]|nr:toxin-antitoxin system HicB family antitoxin [Nocardioidaceae bacterium]
MTQISWRTSEELAARVRIAAAGQHRSVNEFITRVLDAATNPDLADDEMARIRERLARAGLLAPPGEPVERPDPDAVAAARRAAGRGVPLSELVREGRG